MKFLIFLIWSLSCAVSSAKPSLPGVYPYWTYVYVPKEVVLELRQDRSLANLMAVVPRGTCDSAPASTCGVILGGRSTLVFVLSDELSGQEGYVEALESIHMVEEAPGDFDRLTSSMMNVMPLDFYTSFGPIYWSKQFPTFKLIEPQQTSPTGKKLIRGGLYLPLIGLFPDFTKKYCPKLPQSWGIARWQLNLCNGITVPERVYGDFVGFDVQIAPDILDLSVFQFVQFFGYRLGKYGTSGARLQTGSAAYVLKTVTEATLRKGIVGLQFLLPQPVASEYRRAFGKSLEIRVSERSRNLVISLNPYAVKLPQRSGAKERERSCCRP